MSDLKQVVEENFTRYAGNVILDRAICDVRDMLKPSARMLMYSQVHITKNIPSKPFVKSARVVGDCLGHYYTHGDGSCYSTYMRMAKPFAMRYPLEDCQGNSGTITATGDEAASRYTELRLSKLGYLLFDTIEKETINEWCDNFDETDTYPKVLCSKGFYNIVNGSTGISVGLSANIPQFNLREINEGMITLIQDPTAEINIMPDFATGGILLNADEVKESLKNGWGYACKLRSVVDFNEKERVFIVKELPYGVYTSTISEQIQKLLEKDPNCGIEGINDGSGKTPDYIIYLSKKANPTKVLKLLYKETSLQSHYTINMNVLVDNGKTPKLMGLKEMLLAHIEHEKEVYRNGFEFDLHKIESRLHIIDGILLCLSQIEEVIQTIKQSASTAAASLALQTNFLLDEVQAKAVLDMKLSRLAHLEVEKLENEKKKLLSEARKIKEILENEELFNQQLINGWREVADKFGDERRTKILNLTSKEDEIVEEKQLTFSFTNKGAVFVDETSTLYAQRRNGVGSKFKLEKGEYIIDNLIGKNTDKILFFSSKGNYFHANMNDFTIGEKQYISSFINSDESIVAAATSNADKKYIIFITKNGILKKSELSEYNLTRKSGTKALNLDVNDLIVSVLFTNNETIGIMSTEGNFIIIETKNINPIGRIARGVIGMKLNDKDYVQCAAIIPSSTKEIMSISLDGMSKRTSITEFNITGRGTKGSKIQKTDTSMVDFLPILNDGDILITSNISQIRLKKNDIPLLSKSTQGVKTLKLNDNSKIIKINAV